jgi:hypothetical protein
MSLTSSSKRAAQTDDEDLSLSQAELREQEAVMSKRAYSGLSGSQIRWMAKRKPSASTSAKSFIPPSRVLQLHSIFKGLDFDGSGEISLEELKDAIKYVSTSNTGTGPPLIKDPEGIANLFQSMDIDGNGVVDFEEPAIDGAGRAGHNQYHNGYGDERR